jgi:hypothetical protein
MKASAVGDHVVLTDNVGHLPGMTIQEAEDLVAQTKTAIETARKNAAPKTAEEWESIYDREIIRQPFIPSHQDRTAFFQRIMDAEYERGKREPYTL